MKDRDTKLYLAVFLLIFLVALLLVVTINRDPNIKIQQLNRQIIKIQQQLDAKPILKDGHTPVLGVDYTIQNGKDGRDAPPVPPASPGKDGHDGLSITGRDGSNGLSAYDLAVQDGFQGTKAQWLDSLKIKGDKGDPADELDITCIDGKIGKRYASDSFWQLTNIKCEATDE